MKSIQFESLFFSKTNDFLNIYLPRQNGRTADTVKSYREGLSTFYDYVSSIKKMDVAKFQFEDCTYEFLLDYVQYLRETKKHESSTTNQKLASLRSYLRFASSDNVELIQVYLAAKSVPFQKEPRKQRPIIEADAMQKLLDKPLDTVKGNRDRMLMILLFDTAIRVAEICAITLGDISLEVSSPTIIINGKGKKQRTVVLGRKTAEHLRHYIVSNGLNGKSPDTPLFPTVVHGSVSHMTERNVERILKKYADQLKAEGVDLPESVYPHMFRRSRATGLSRDGVPIEMVSTILGHAAVETTRIYAIPSVEQMRLPYQKGRFRSRIPVRNAGLVKKMR